MPVTHHSKITQANVLLKTIKERETKDRMSGKTIKFQQVFLDLDHPVDGSHVRGKFSVEICKVTYPRGIEKENNKLTGFGTYNLEDPDVLDCIDIAERTQKSGWCKKKDFAVKIKPNNCTATAKSDTQLYDEVDGSAIADISKSDVLIYEDETEDEEWIQVKTKGKPGSFSIMMNKIAEVLFENRAAIGYASVKNVDGILAKMKSPVYWHRNKETGQLNFAKKPSTYWKNTYFGSEPARDGKQASKERYARYTIPGSGDLLELDVMMKSSFTVKPIITLTNVYIGADKITPQFYVTSGVVYDINEIERINEQQSTIDELSKDEELVKRLQEKLSNSKNFTPYRNNYSDEEQEVNKEESTDTSGNASLSDILEGGPTIKKVNLDTKENGDDDDDINIPGLDNL